ncbi:MAG: YaaC family protein [Gemmatimonadaceae bacterium]
MNDPWSELSLFESRDVVERKFRKRHDRSLGAEKAREIVSAFAQAREFFRSAAAAADLVRPLLLYYGVLTLTRALVLFLRPRVREAALKQSHGLGVLDWGEQLSGGVKNLPEVRIRLEAGTFAELAEATENTERTLIWRAPYPNRGLLTQMGSSQYPQGFELTASDILGRIPDIAPLYEEVFASLPACVPGFVFLLSEATHTGLNVFPLNGRLIPEDELRQAFIRTEVSELRQTTKHNFRREELHWSWRVEHSSLDELTAALPPIAADARDEIYLVRPLASGVRMSTLSLLFGASYMLGMLARYYPTHWLSLLARQKGDFTLPLLREALRVIATRYPELVLTAL